MTVLSTFNDIKPVPPAFKFETYMRITPCSVDLFFNLNKSILSMKFTILLT